jgi:hypothetical protein
LTGSLPTFIFCLRQEAMRRPHHAAITRLAILLLLVSIMGDMGDSYCEPVPVSTEARLTAPQESAAADPCAEGCVADCFCCSHPVPALREQGVGSFHSTLNAWPQIVPLLAAGVPRAVEHVPLRLS